MKIGIDCDGVLYDFVDSLREYLVVHEGFQRSELPDPTCWTFYKDDWGMSLEDYLFYTGIGVDAGVVFLHGGAELDAKLVMTRLREQGHTLHIVTNRHFGTKSVANTEEWLKREGIPYDTLTISRDKTIVDVDLFLDDFIDNYKALEAAGTEVVMFDRPWNQELSGANRVYDWWGFYYYVLSTPEPGKIVVERDYQTGLQEAQGLVYGDRNADYGHPADDYNRTAALWTALLGQKLKNGEHITPQQAILMMILVKTSRLTNDHNKRDSWVDIAGYAECGLRINRREAGLE